MAEREYPAVTVNLKSENRLRSGHPWVYASDVTAVDGEYKNGDIADVYSSKHKYIGSGFINDNSKILVRLISRNANDRFDEAFWERRIKYATEYRKSIFSEESFRCCRLIFGDSDCFPGFIADRFEDILSVQILSLGIDCRKDMLIPLLVKVLNEQGIKINAVYERNDVAVREKEGLSQYKGFFRHEGLSEALNGHVVISENSVKFDVDYINGQKTGFFLDQKLNRAAIRAVARGKAVLDCFTHTGAFALNAACAGAKSVTAVDISQEAINSATVNAELNGLSDKIEFLCENVFDLLSGLAAEKKSPYDFIILDPPAFTKSSSTVTAAYRGYKEINYRAMRILPRGGYLATCSCSHFMTDELFRKMLADAASDADVSLRQIQALQQSPDHPVLWGVPETDYLKFYIFQVV